MVATQIATQISRFYSSTPNLRRPTLKTALSRRLFLVRASLEPQRPGPDAANHNPLFVSQIKSIPSNTLQLTPSDEQVTSNELSSFRTSLKNKYQPLRDLNYLVKLGAGSVAGAAAIKYGSILFPETTRPNLGLALFMISAPVVVAVLILIKQNRVD